MTIKTINGEPYLSALPVKEFETLYKNRDVKTNVVINSDMPFIKSIQSKACDISVSASAEKSFLWSFSVLKYLLMQMIKYCSVLINPHRLNVRTAQ